MRGPEYCGTMHIVKQAREAQQARPVAPANTGGASDLDQAASPGRNDAARMELRRVDRPKRKEVATDFEFCQPREQVLVREEQHLQAAVHGQAVPRLEPGLAADDAP